jgi:hypothetical protein
MINPVGRSRSQPNPRPVSGQFREPGNLVSPGVALFRLRFE